jgi:hypothetical protein
VQAGVAKQIRTNGSNPAHGDAERRDAANKCAEVFALPIICASNRRLRQATVSRTTAKYLNLIELADQIASLPNQISKQRLLGAKMSRPHRNLLGFARTIRKSFALQFSGWRHKYDRIAIDWTYCCKHCSGVELSS